MNKADNKAKSIVFLLPSKAPDGPVGGYKVVYEYSNRLVEEGYDVTLAYPLTMQFSNESVAGKLKTIPRGLKWMVKGFSGRNWFPIDPRVKERVVLSLNERDVPNADIYIATAVRTAYYLSGYRTDPKGRFYLIQGFEAWRDPEEYVYDSYRLGLRNIVISSWLKDLVEKTGAKTELIKNGFDFDYFRLTLPIEEKPERSVSMLWHPEERKGGAIGLRALETVREKYPDLKVRMFGVPERPGFLPEWVEYYQTPDRETHNRIYNESTIYLAPSLSEGWGLTIGEAMICGAAVVCTDTLGFLEMVTDGETGLVSPGGDAESLATNMLRLLDNPEERLRLARNGNRHIHSFRWEDSFNRLVSLFE